MTVHNYTNTASTAQLDAPLNSSATSFQVTGLTGYPSAPFYILMDRDTSSAELMEVTQVAGSTLTVVRGAGGTASTPHSSGATVEHVIPAAVPQAVEQHVEATTDVHGVTGALVGATNEGVLSNKTYRGVGRHVYSDTLPADPAAGFIVEADTSISRDGFVAAGSAANTDRHGFLLTQAGAERFQVRYDGTVRVNPSGASSHPAIESTGSIETEDLVVNDDLTVNGSASVLQDFSAQTVTAANVNVASGLAVTGTTTAGQVNASGTLTAAGSGTGLVVNNSASVGQALSIAGSGTALTLSGSNARLRFPSSPTAATPGTASGEVRHRARRLEVWDNDVGQWFDQGGALGLRTEYNFSSGGSVGSRAVINSWTHNGLQSGAPYFALVQGQCEINDNTPGSRHDLFVTIDDDNPDPGGANVLAVGVGPGFTQTGLGCSAPLTGEHTYYLVVERTVGGSGTCNISAFNQMFTVVMIPTVADD